MPGRFIVPVKSGAYLHVEIILSATGQDEWAQRTARAPQGAYEDLQRLHV